MVFEIKITLSDEMFIYQFKSESQKYTYFVKHNGLYEFLFAPFGISNLPAVFTRFVNAKALTQLIAFL